MIRDALELTAADVSAEQDLKLSTTSPSGVVSTLRYSTANSAFYWGYIGERIAFEGEN